MRVVTCRPVPEMTANHPPGAWPRPEIANYQRLAARCGPGIDAYQMPTGLKYHPNQPAASADANVRCHEELRQRPTDFGCCLALPCRYDAAVEMCPAQYVYKQSVRIKGFDNAKLESG